MKKKIFIVVIIILIAIIVAGIITNYADSGRVTTGHEPKYCIKTISEDGSKVTYWGLGYKVIRYVGISPNEPYESNIGSKMGNWFMKYDLPRNENITIEYEGSTIVVTNNDDISMIENILVNSKYDSELCEGINTHKITLGDEIYYIKEDCKEIQKGDKQAKITDEDLDKILKIIDNNVKENNDEIKSLEGEIDMNKFVSKINIKINNKDYTVTLEDNDTTRELVKRLPLEINMTELNGNEKYYYFENQLPSNPSKIGKIEKGDIMLYGSDCLVIFYESFNTQYSYTRIGKIDNPEDLDTIVGNKNIIVNVE